MLACLPGRRQQQARRHRQSLHVHPLPPPPRAGGSGATWARLSGVTLTPEGGGGTTAPPQEPRGALSLGGQKCAVLPCTKVTETKSKTTAPPHLRPACSMTPRAADPHLQEVEAGAPSCPIILVTGNVRHGGTAACRRLSCLIACGL